MRTTIASMVGAIGLILGTAGTVSAQQGLEFRPIDTDKLIVQPTDAATNIFSGTTRLVTRTIASAIENNGFVRTVNNLFGRDTEPTPPQPGLSPLPQPGLYPSTRYTSPLTPSMPRAQRFGTSVR